MGGKLEIKLLKVKRGRKKALPIVQVSGIVCPLISTGSKGTLWLFLGILMITGDAILVSGSPTVSHILLGKVVILFYFRLRPKETVRNTPGISVWYILKSQLCY